MDENILFYSGLPDETSETLLLQCNYLKRVKNPVVISCIRNCSPSMPSPEQWELKLLLCIVIELNLYMFKFLFMLQLHCNGLTHGYMRIMTSWLIIYRMELKQK